MNRAAALVRLLGPAPTGRLDLSPAEGDGDLERWWVAAVQWLVPRRLRGSWRREWDAELHHRWSVLGRWQRPHRTDRAEAWRQAGQLLEKLVQAFCRTRSTPRISATLMAMVATVRNTVDLRLARLFEPSRRRFTVSPPS